MIDVNINEWIHSKREEERNKSEHKCEGERKCECQRKSESQRNVRVNANERVNANVRVKVNVRVNVNVRQCKYESEHKCESELNFCRILYHLGEILRYYLKFHTVMFQINVVRVNFPRNRKVNPIVLNFLELSCD